METDSPTARRQKEQMREAVAVAYDITLPLWFVEGTTTVQFRALRALLEDAHTRYMSQGTVPVRHEPEPERCETCHKVHKPPEVVGAGGIKFWPGHEYIIRTKTTMQRYPREWRMGYLGFGAGMEWSARGPDRTHGGQYGGTQHLDLADIIYAEEVVRDDVKRHVGELVRETA
jgi:hypothetical protein